MAAPGERITEQGARRLIAMVEDNPDNRLLLRALLEERYDLLEYDGGPAFLGATDSARADLVLLDISMPGMDGIEVLGRMRKDAARAGMPAVALTAHAMQGARQQLLSHGFDGYLSKPIQDEEDLVAAIEGCLARRAPRGQPDAQNREPGPIPGSVAVP